MLTRTRVGINMYSTKTVGRGGRRIFARTFRFVGFVKFFSSARRFSSLFYSPPRFLSPCKSARASLILFSIQRPFFPLFHHLDLVRRAYVYT